MRRTVTDGLPAFAPTTQTASDVVASPVGGSCTATRVTVRVFGSIRATVWSSRFATHNEPDP